MKKIIALSLVSLLSMSAFAQTMTVTKPDVAMKKFAISKFVQWDLDAASNPTYLIQNPTHTPLNFMIQVYSGSGDAVDGTALLSAPIEVTCGDKVFQLSPTNNLMGTCSTTDDISFKAITSGNLTHTRGDFTLEIA